MKKKIILSFVVGFLIGGGIVYASSVKLFSVKTDDNITVFDIKQDLGRTNLNLYPSLEEDRVKFSFRANPTGSETQYRPLSIETHGHGDTSDPNNRDVTFYTDTTERFKKAFQWHWGLDFEDNPEIEFFADLYPSSKYDQPYDLGNSENSWDKTYTNILHLTPRTQPETAELGDIYLGLDYKLHIHSTNGWN